MSDFGLIKAAERGDIDAFTTLYERFSDMAVKAALRVTGSLPEAEDAAMEMWSWLPEGRWRIDDRIGRDVTAHAFIATLARFAAFKQIYRPFAFQRGIDEPETVFARLHAPTATPERRMLRKEFRLALRHVVAALPRPYRRAAHLRYVEELSCRDIGARMGLKGTTIPGYLHQVRIRLRDGLQGYIDLPQHIRQNGYHRYRHTDTRDGSPSPRITQADGSPSRAGS